MPRVLNLADVFQLVVDGLEQCALPQEQFVPETPHAILHVLAHFRQQFESLGEEGSVECLRNLAAIAKELAEEPLHEERDGLPIINMARRQPQREEFAFIIHDEMQFKAIEPAHRRLVPGRDVLADPVRRNTVIVAHRKRRRVDKGNAWAPALARVEITTQRDERAELENWGPSHFSTTLLPFAPPFLGLRTGDNMTAPPPGAPHSRA